MAFGLRSLLAAASKRTMQLSPNHHHHRQHLRRHLTASNRQIKKPKVAPVAELERRLRNPQQKKDTVLRLYETERENFLSPICWTAAVERLFLSTSSPSDLKQMNLPQFWHTTCSSKSTSSEKQEPPSSVSSSIDVNHHQQQPRRLEDFLNHLAQVMETKGIAFFGRISTAKIARILSTNATISHLPAVVKFVTFAGNHISVLVEKGQPMDVTDVIMALARLNLRETFETAMEYLQQTNGGNDDNDDQTLDRLQWLLTQETTPSLICTCAVMNHRAPRLFHVVAQRPKRAIGTHLTVRSVIDVLRALIYLGHGHSTVCLDQLTTSHSIASLISRATAPELADVAEVLSYAEQYDGTLFFEAMEKQAEDFATNGKANDFAKLLKAACIVLGPGQIPALSHAIDQMANKIRKQCLLPVPLHLRRLNTGDSNPEKQQEQEEKPPSETDVMDAAINDAINKALLKSTSMQKKKNQNKVEEKSTSSTTVQTLVTIVHAYSLLQHPCPTMHQMMEDWANMVVAQATPRQQEAIVKSLESLGYDIPKFKEAMVQQQQQTSDTTQLVPQQQQQQQDNRTQDNDPNALMDGWKLCS